MSTPRPTRTATRLTLGTLVVVSIAGLTAPTHATPASATAAEHTDGGSATPDVPGGTPIKEPRPLLTLWEPTNVRVTASADGFTVFGTPQCSSDFKTCRSWFTIPGSGVEHKNVATSGGYYVPWPSSWAPGTSNSAGTIRSYGVSVFGYGYYGRTVGLGTIMRPYQQAPIRADIASQDDAGRTATISGTATPLATIKRGGQTIATANSAGVWSDRVQGLSVGANFLTYEQWVDGTYKDQTTVNVTIAAPVDPISPLTAAYAFPSDPTNVTDLVTVSGTATKGATVEIRPRGNPGAAPIQTAVANANTGAWSTTLPAPNRAGSEDITVSQTVRGSQQSQTVDLSVPYGAAVSVATPVDGAVHGGGPLAMSGTGTPNALVTVADKADPNTSLGSKRVDGDGNWALDTSSIDGSGHTLVVTQTAPGRNVTTQEVSVTAPDLTPDAPSAYGYIDAQNPREWAGVTGIGKPGADVTLYNAANEAIGSSKADDTTGAYNIGIDPDKAEFGRNSFTVKQTADGVESAASAPTVIDYGTPSPVALTAPANGSEVRSSDLQFEGTGATGSNKAVVDVYGTNLTLGSADVTGGNWSVQNTLSLPTGNYHFWAMQYTAGGKSSTAAVDVTITDRAPAPSANGWIDTANPQNGSGIWGTAEPNALITVKRGGTAIATATADGNGIYNVAINGADAVDGVNTFTVTQTVGGKESAATTTTIDYGTTTALTMLTPTQNEHTSSSNLSFSGAGTDGAIVEVYGMSGALGTATVTGGTWTIPNTTNLPAGSYHFWAVQYTPGARTQLVPVDVVID